MITRQRLIDNDAKPFLYQAIGDYQSLDQTGRRAVHVHIPDRTSASIDALATRLLG